MLAEAVSNALADLFPAAAGDAVSSAVGEATAGTSTDRGDRSKALHEFTHQLFQALRPTAGEDGPGQHGRGFAWGRTGIGDIAQRLESLAQRIGGTAAATEVTSVATTAEATGMVDDVGAVDTPASTPGAAQPPAAAATLPSSLLTAFQALARPAGGDQTGSEGSATAATSLAALLSRIAQTVQADPTAAGSVTGSLVDTAA